MFSLRFNASKPVGSPRARDRLYTPSPDSSGARTACSVNYHESKRAPSRSCCIKRFGLGIERLALGTLAAYRAKAFHAQLFSRSHHRADPLLPQLLELLAAGVLLLADHLLISEIPHVRRTPAKSFIQICRRMLATAMQSTPALPYLFFMRCIFWRPVEVFSSQSCMLETAREATCTGTSCLQPTACGQARLISWTFCNMSPRSPCGPGRQLPWPACHDDFADGFLLHHLTAAGQQKQAEQQRAPARTGLRSLHGLGLHGRGLHCLHHGLLHRQRHG